MSGWGDAVGKQPRASHLAGTGLTSGWQSPPAPVAEPAPVAAPEQAKPAVVAGDDVEVPGQYRACFRLYSRAVPSPVFYDAAGDAYIAPPWMMRLPGIAPLSGGVLCLAWHSMRVTMQGRALHEMVDAVQFHSAAKFRTYHPKLYPDWRDDGRSPLIEEMVITDGEGAALERPPSFLRLTK